MLLIRASVPAMAVQLVLATALVVAAPAATGLVADDECAAASSTGPGGDLRACALSALQARGRRLEAAEAGLPWPLDPTGAGLPWWLAPVVAKPAVRPPAGCASLGENCIATGSCCNLALTCYAKDEAFAFCLAGCSPGVHEEDPPQFRTPWSCRKVRPPKAACSVAYVENCMETGACCDPDMKCYVKDEEIAVCLRSCTPGVHVDDPLKFQTPWSCKEFGRAAGPEGAGGRAETCAAAFTENCAPSGGRCCDPGMTCYAKDETFALCLRSCTPGIHEDDPAGFRTPWTCKPVGDSPSAPLLPSPQTDCSGAFVDNCINTKACCDPSLTCYAKDEGLALCLPGCAPGVHADDPPLYQTPWTCENLGPGPDAAPPRLPQAGYSPSNPALLRPSAGKLFTFYMYRAQSGAKYAYSNTNTGNLAGIMWYIQNEVVSGDWGTTDKYGITRILRLKVQMKATQPLLDRGMNFGVRVAFDYGQCTGPTCSYDWRTFGYNVGCNLLGFYPFPKFATLYPDGVWYSLPGECPSKPYYSQTDECRRTEPGGLCSIPTGAGDCTWNYKEAGEISLAELYGTQGKDRFWADGQNTTANWLKVKAARDLFESKYGKDLPEPNCDFDEDAFYKGYDWSDKW